MKDGQSIDGNTPLCMLLSGHSSGAHNSAMNGASQGGVGRGSLSIFVRLMMPRYLDPTAYGQETYFRKAQSTRMKTRTVRSVGRRGQVPEFHGTRRCSHFPVTLFKFKSEHAGRCGLPRLGSLPRNGAKTPNMGPTLAIPVRQKVGTKPAFRNFQAPDPPKQKNEMWLGPWMRCTKVLKT